MINERFSNIQTKHIGLLFSKYRAITHANNSTGISYLHNFTVKIRRSFTKCYSPGRTLFLIVLLSLLTINISVNASNEFEQRYSSNSDKTRVVFEFSQKVGFSWQTSSNSSEIILTIVNPSDIERLTNNGKFELSSSHIETLKYVHDKNNNNLEIVIHLKNSPDFAVFDLSPSIKNGHRVIVDLFTAAKPVYASVLPIQDSTSTINSEQTLGTPNSALSQNEPKLEPVLQAPKIEPAQMAPKLASVQKAPTIELTQKTPVLAPLQKAPLLKPAPALIKIDTLADNSPMHVSKPLVSSPSSSELTVKPTKYFEVSKKKFVIVIDPGHGGVDLGSISPNNIFEKDLTLSIAHYLRDQLNTIENVTATLTRSSDVYVYPHKRTEIAEKSKADMLISLHAEGHTSDEGQQLSVWSYQSTAASSAHGRDLIQAESEAVLLGNVADLLNNVSQENTVNARNVAYVDADKVLRSDKIANILSTNLKNKFKQVAPSAQQANFIILAGKKVPSIVVNFGYLLNEGTISNNEITEQDKELGNVKSKLLEVVAATINEYSLIPERDFYKHNYQMQASQKGPVRETKEYVKTIVNEPLESAQTFEKELLADNSFQTHKVGKGDSLYQISKTYNTSINVLKDKNKLPTNAIQIGQDILVPTLE